jgi:hypothetical protein
MSFQPDVGAARTGVDTGETELTEAGTTAERPEKGLRGPVGVTFIEGAWFTATAGVALVTAAIGIGVATGATTRPEGDVGGRDWESCAANGGRVVAFTSDSLLARALLLASSIVIQRSSAPSPQANSLFIPAQPDNRKALAIRTKLCFLMIIVPS